MRVRMCPWIKNVHNTRHFKAGVSFSVANAYVIGVPKELRRVKFPASEDFKAE